MEDRRRRDIPARYGSMERVPFSSPFSPYTLYPRATLHPASSIYPDTSLYPASALSDCLSVYPAGSLDGALDLDLEPERGRAASRHWALDLDLDLERGRAASRHGALDLERGLRHRSMSMDSYTGSPAASRHGEIGRRSMESLWAGAAHHFGAAARLMEEAERRRRASGQAASEDNIDADPEHGLPPSSDDELPPPPDDDHVPNLSGNSSEDSNAGDDDEGLLNAVCGLLDAVCGGGDGGDDEVFVLITKAHGWELLGYLLTFAPPCLTYKAADQDYLNSSSWPQFLFMYGVVVTIVVTFLAAITFGRSRCCWSCILLRFVFLTFAVAAEGIAAMNLLTDDHHTKTDTAGSCLTIIHLVLVYIITWCLQCCRRRRRRPRRR